MRIKPSYFTTKTALGDQFCNRDAERAVLKDNIVRGEHSVVVAPRRFGKTSLVCQVLKETKVNYARVDLFCAAYAKSVCEKLAKGVSELTAQLVPFSAKAAQFIETCFKSTNVILRAGQLELQVNLTKIEDKPIDKITDLLTGLEKVAEKKKKRVVLFIDEFQDLLRVEYANEIQAAIREVAQHCRYTSYIFSGSSRTMLKEIFEDREQPLYMLCKKIQLAKISAQNFKKHILLAAKKTWSGKLSSKLVEQILLVTECHPYYLNLLCEKLWLNKKLPNITDINQAWEACLFEQRDKLISDLSPLNSNRLKVLKTIALLGEVSEPNGKHFLGLVGLPLSSVQKVVSFLIDNDYIYQNQQQLMLIDPLLKKFIQQSFA